MALKLMQIPKDKYEEYRYEVIFNAYKWDPQVEDQNTIASYCLLMDKNTVKELEVLSEKLYSETIALEKSILKNTRLQKEIGIPRKIRSEFKKCHNTFPKDNVRLMRFDFHPTTDGWRISEVNSDVPGGLAEAAVLPSIASKHIKGTIYDKNILNIIIDSFKSLIKTNSSICFIHATSYADDYQVMKALGDQFEICGYNALYLAPDHLKWENGQAKSALNNENISGIVRFFPLEWLVNLKRKKEWKGYFNTSIPSCNPPMAFLSQPKRVPLIWDKLNIDLSAWRALLPRTTKPKLSIANDEKWIYKPNLGRVGQNITIKGTISNKEYKLIKRNVRLHPKNWVVQEKFESIPLRGNNEEFHLCIGVFVVDGKCAGLYGRINNTPRIDDKAIDIPILIGE